MEDSSMDWDNFDYCPDEYMEYEGEDEKSRSGFSWVLSKGLSLGKKLAVTGVVVSSAPIVVPPLLVVSALGIASSVPFGFMYASYTCTEKLMSKLLPLPEMIDYHDEEEDMIGYRDQLGDDVDFNKRYYQEELAYDNGEFVVPGKDSYEGISQEYDMVRDDTNGVGVSDDEIIVTSGEAVMPYHGEYQVQLDDNVVDSSDKLNDDNNEVMQLTEDYSKELRAVEELSEDVEELWKDDLIRGDSFGVTEGDAPFVTDEGSAVLDTCKKEDMISNENVNDMLPEEVSISEVGILEEIVAIPAATPDIDLFLEEGSISAVGILEEIVATPAPTPNIDMFLEEDSISAVGILEEIVATPAATPSRDMLLEEGSISTIGVAVEIVATPAGTPEAIEAADAVTTVKAADEFVVEGPIGIAGVVEEIMAAELISPDQTPEAVGVEIPIFPAGTPEAISVEVPITPGGTVEELLVKCPTVPARTVGNFGQPTVETVFAPELHGVINDSTTKIETAQAGLEDNTGTEVERGSELQSEGNYTSSQKQMSQSELEDKPDANFGGKDGKNVHGSKGADKSKKRQTNAKGKKRTQKTQEGPVTPAGKPEADGAKGPIIPAGTLQTLGIEEPGTPETFRAEGPVTAMGKEEDTGVEHPVIPYGTVEEVVGKGPTIPVRTILSPELHGGVNDSRSKHEIAQAGSEPGAKLGSGSELRSKVNETSSSQKEVVQSDLIEKPDTKVGRNEKDAHGSKAADGSKKRQTNAKGKKKTQKTQGPITPAGTPQTLGVEVPVSPAGKPEEIGVECQITPYGTVEEVVVKGPSMPVGTVLGPELHGDSRSNNEIVQADAADKTSAKSGTRSELQSEVTGTSSSRKEVVESDLIEKADTKVGGDEKHAHGSKAADGSKKLQTNAKGKKRTPKQQGPVTPAGRQETLGAKGPITPAGTPQTLGVEVPIVPAATPRALSVEGPITAAGKPQEIGVECQITPYGTVEEVVAKGPSMPAGTVLGPELHDQVNDSRSNSGIVQAESEDKTGAKPGTGSELQNKVTEASSSRKEVVQSDLMDKPDTKVGDDEKNDHGSKAADESKKRHTNVKEKKKTLKTQKRVQGDISKAQEDRMKHENAAGKVSGSALRESKVIWDGDAVIDEPGLSPQVVGQLKITEVIPVDKNQSGPSIKDGSKSWSEGDMKKSSKLGSILYGESKENNKNIGPVERETVNNESEVQIGKVSAPVHVLKQHDQSLELTGSSSHEADNSHHHNKDVPGDDEIWRQIDSIRLIVGFKLPRHTSYFEELKALYIFTGIEPPTLFRDPSDMPEFCHKLRFLMSVIGVK